MCGQRGALSAPPFVCRSTPITFVDHLRTTCVKRMWFSVTRRKRWRKSLEHSGRATQSEPAVPSFTAISLDHPALFPSSVTPNIHILPQDVIWSPLKRLQSSYDRNSATVRDFRLRVKALAVQVQECGKRIQRSRATSKTEPFRYGTRERHLRLDVHQQLTTFDNFLAHAGQENPSRLSQLPQTKDQADENTPCARCAARNLMCEYMAVSAEQAQSVPQTQRGRNSPPRSTPIPRPYTPQPPQRYISSTRASAPSYAPTYYQEYNPSQFGSPTPIYHGNRPPPQPQLPVSGSRDLYNYGASSSTSISHENRPAPHPQFPAGSSDTYQYGGVYAASSSYEGNQPPLPLSPPPQFTASHSERRGGRSHTPHGPSHATSRFLSQQPGSSGYPSDYDRYFAGFGLPPSYDPDIHPGRLPYVLCAHPRCVTRLTVLAWSIMRLWQD
ncbi:hypothetical protein DFH09DRAFT_1088561 [Mycena vulgaris]|nr:hypothetical protein DFH09DRAFT_1088561 [Mycena vulgaris]